MITWQLRSSFSALKRVEKGQEAGEHAHENFLYQMEMHWRISQRHTPLQSWPKIYRQAEDECKPSWARKSEEEFEAWENWCQQ